MPSSLYVPFLLAGMLLAGNHVLYEQPVWQTLQMFGFLPIIYTWLRTRRQSPSVQLQADSDEVTPNKLAPQPLEGWHILLLWIPAACDLTGTTLMSVGLLYTPVSIYQMTRGALVLFVGVFSVIFLRRRLWLYQWVSLIIVMLGVALVGYSGSLIKDAIKQSVVHNLGRALGLHHDPHTLATEEPEVTQVLVGRYSVSPLVAVGYEGLFGTISILMIVPILSIPSVSALSPFFDIPRGWYQMINTPTVLYSGLAICVSVSLFNFFGLSVTRHVSATARSLTDACRTLFICIISLGLGWEKLVFPISLLQVLGFSLLFLFNNLVKPLPCLPSPRPAAAPVAREEDEEEPEGLLTTTDETAALPADLGQSGFDVVPEGQHALAGGNAKSTHAD
ncbi:hypothetical protein BDZ97DRAFT_1905908 [Flammula alnicola]|nr:hypothetical protein BDZ97DRAFT_1905908 [Flammula alnicola]